MRTYIATLTGPTARKGSIALIDQTIISGTNFLTGVLLARLCSEEEYGAYVLAFSILLFVNGVQSALITGPMMVLGAPKEGEEMRSYFSALGAAQGVIGLVLAVLAISAGLAVGMLHAYNESFRSALFGMGIALFFIQAQEFFRRVLFTRLLTHRVLFNDAMYSSVQLVGIFLLWRLGGGRWSPGTPGYLSGGNVFLWMSIAALVGSVLGFLQCRGLVVPALIDAKKHLKESWNFAKWGLLGLVGGTATIQANTWIIGALGGQSAAALVEAPRLIVAPLQILLFGLGNVLTPRASGIYSAHGRTGLADFLRRISIVWILIGIGFTSVTFLFGKAMLISLYGSKYSETYALLTIWAILYAVLGLRQVPGYGIAAIRKPEIGVGISTSVGAITLLATAILMLYGGIVYALGARLGGEILVLILMTFFLRARLPQNAA